MDWTMVSVVGQWLNAIAAAAIFVYALYRDYWRRPKLVLTFDNDRDVKNQTNTVLNSDGKNPIPQSRWLRVRVENISRWRTAKNCRAYLIGVKKVGLAANGQGDLKDDVRPLVWMHDPSGRPSKRDLLPWIAHWVDIVFTEPSDARLNVCVYPPWHRLGPGDYEFTVQVSADGADPAVIKVRVSCDESWESLRGQFSR